jgi:hypothetical protein
VRFASIPTVKKSSAFRPSWIRSMSTDGDSPPLWATITTASRTQNSTPRRVVKTDPIFKFCSGQRKDLGGKGASGEFFRSQHAQAVMQGERLTR